MKKINEKVISKIPWRGRGLDRLTFKIGDVTSLIESKIGQLQTQKILEIGTGYGQVLIELSNKYGNKLELYGINKEENYVDLEFAKQIAIYKQSIDRSFSPAENQINFISCDAGISIPFPENFFDFVFSQVSIAYVSDKMNLLSEVSRVLKHDGKAVLHSEFEHKGKIKSEQDDWDTLVIYRGDKLISLSDYFESFKNIEYIHSPRGSIVKINGGCHNKFDTKFMGVEEFLNKNFHGVKSVYLVI